MMLLQLPDTKLVAEASGIVREALTPALWNHSLRSFLLGRAYGRKRGLDFDEEGFHLAALFHDLGMCSPEVDRGVSFQQNGSRKLREFLRTRGVGEDRITPLTEAVDFHMQLRPRWDKGNVAGLMHVGAWTDLTFRNRLALRNEGREIARAYSRKAIGLRFPFLLMGSIRSVSACTGIFAPREGTPPRE